MTTRYVNAKAGLDAGGVLILDGGVSTELERRGVPMSDRAWSGRVALDDWEAIVGVHLAYIEAGADVITTNTYATSRLVLAGAGLGERVEEINRRSIEAAFEARTRSGRDDLLVAGSMSHMVPVATGGYLPDLVANPDPDLEVMEAAFREMRAIHEDAGVDLLLLEMLSVRGRMTAMFDALDGTGLPVWCGLAAAREGNGIAAWHDRATPFADVVAVAARRNFDLLGIMHTQADLIAQALPILRAAHDGPLMAYPDSGYFEMPHWRFVDTLAPERFADLARGWRDQGAQVLGGCCGLGPEHIAAIAPLKRAAA